MKIFVIFTGGTIGSSVNCGTISANESNAPLLLDLFKQKTKKDIDFTVARPYYALSENNTGTEINSLVQCVSSALKKDYDGIIVTHGTDTLQYTAAALSYAFGANTVPIVLVSSNYVLTDKRANGVENFISAVNFIEQKGGKGAFVSYKNTGGVSQIHRASRLLAHSEYSDDLFSVKNQFYGSFENEIFVKNRCYTAKNDETKPFGNIELDKNSGEIKVIHQYLGFEYPIIEKDTIAVIIKAYHSGTLCTDNDNFRAFANDLKARKIHCFICGAENKTIYESAEVFGDYGFKILPVSSFISQYIKLWYAAKAGRDLETTMRSSIGEDVI